MLSIHRLSCLRGQRVLFSELNFALAPTELLHIRGPNGCGKSSLLQIIAGLLTPYAGEIRWQGLPIIEADSYRSCFDYIGHKTGINQRLTVLENLQLAATLNGLQAKKCQFDTVLEQVGLQHFQNHLCLHLSAGQRQRVALARLLLRKAPLWILDESFTTLDIPTSHTLQQFILTQCRQGGMVILTSHHELDWQGDTIKRLEL